MRYKSSIDGIVWPAVAEPQASALLAILFQLEQSQWWPPAELSRRQPQAPFALAGFAFHAGDSGGSCISAICSRSSSIRSCQ